jgi:hypothetical protein
MRPVPSSLAIAMTLVLLSIAGAACSSTESGAGGGPAGMGGGVGSDTSCLDGSDGCVWSCASAAEMENPSAPFPYCDAGGKFQCPTGSQRLSACPPGSCARFGPFCCDSSTGQVSPPPCKPDGFRDVCPDVSQPNYSQCRAPGLGVTKCIDLDQTACASSALECHGLGDCTCTTRGDGSLVWDCPIYIP